MTIKRIGFACKWIDRPDQINGIKANDACRVYNTGATTVAWLNRQTREKAEEKLWSLMTQNIESARQLVKKVGGLNEQLRMVRLSSDLLPVYTEPNWSYFYKQSDVVSYAQSRLVQVGDLARKHNVRLSFHPGQFCVLVSDNDDVVRRSIEDLEYHADMARWMGYGLKKLDFKINTHLSGRRGVDGFDAAWNQLSPELRNCLTLENDEYQQNIDSLIKIKDRAAIVLDIHHHLISDGEYIDANDDRIKSVIDSWAGVRPVIHYSQSRDEYIGHYGNRMPAMTEMLTETNRSKLRAHSDFYTNRAINNWALTHLDWADIMCESKAKNLASFALAEQAKDLEIF